MAAATTAVIGVPVRAVATVCNGGRRKFLSPPPTLCSYNNASLPFPSLHFLSPTQNCFALNVVSCLPSPRSSKTPSNPSTKLFVSGLSFRTTEESLRNAFKIFGELLEVNLVMDKIANRPKGFAFIQYATKEESQKAIEGMHGKVRVAGPTLVAITGFVISLVIFVEVAKSRAELRQNLRQN